MSIKRLKENVSIRVAAGALGVTMALALLGSALPAQAASLTSAQVQSIVSLLQSFGADATTVANVQATLMGQATTGTTGGSTTTGSSAGCYAYTRNLTIGSTGTDVMMLQEFLNAHGDMVASAGAGSPGMESTYFGALTQSALAKWQAASGVSPAAGYFGSISRGAIATWCAGQTTGTTGGTTGGTTTGGSTTLNGVGQLSSITGGGAVESSLNEGDPSTPVVGVQSQVQGGDLMLQRVDATFDMSGSSGSTALSKYVSSVDLYVNGNKVASMNPSDGSYDNKVWTYRFTNIGNVVLKSGSNANIYVQVTPVTSIGANENGGQITAEIPSDGIRVLDGSGISDTYGVSNGESEQFTVNLATTGTLTASEASNNPDDTTVTVDANNQTTNVPLLGLDLRAKNQDVTINTLPIGLNIASTSATDVSDVVQSVTLSNGSWSTTSSVPTGTGKYATVVFNNINQTIDQDSTQNYTLTANLKKEGTNGSVYADGTTLMATSTGSDSNWDVQDDQGNSVTPTGGANGGTMVLQTTGISVALNSATYTFNSGSGVSGGADSAQYSISFTVTAGDDDIWIGKNVASHTATTTANMVAGTINYATTTTSGANVTGTASTNFTASGTTNNDVTAAYKVPAGSSRTFTLNVGFTATTSGYTGVELTGIGYSSASDQSGSGSLLTTGLTDFKTADVLLQMH